MPSQFLEGEQPKEIWSRITRAMKIVVLVASLLALDGFNRQMSLIDSYDLLPGVLYDFSAKYKDLLIKWYRTSSQGSNTQDIIIPFERRYSGVKSTAGYYQITQVPLLESYLSERIPVLGSKSRLFFGYEMAWPIYFYFMLCFPTMVLLYVVWNLARLKRLWLTSVTDASRFVADIPFFRNSKGRTAVGALESFIVMTFLLFVLFLMRALLWSQLFGLQLPIRGKLYIEPLSLPVIESGRDLLLLHNAEVFGMQYVPLFFVEVGALVVMLWMLLRKNRLGQP
jgi:hypothetical protein